MGGVAMGGMLVAGLAAIAAAVFLAAWTVFGGGASSLARDNLARDSRARDAAAALGSDASQFTASAAPSRFDVAARELAPPTAVRRISNLVGATGVATGRLDSALRAKILLGLGALIVGVLIGIAMASPLGWVLAALFAVIGWFGPDAVLYGRAKERRTAIDAGLADMLDQLTIAVEAGLGFEAALLRITRNGRGPLAEELVRTLQDIQLGQSRRDAYRALGDRAGVPDLSRFVRAIVQADAYGVPISTVLRTQSHEVRVKRRQRLEEQAMKIPIKVTFPLMVCLMPVLFIVVLGPAILSAMATL